MARNEAASILTVKLVCSQALSKAGIDAGPIENNANPPSRRVFGFVNSSMSSGMSGLAVGPNALRDKSVGERYGVRRGVGRKAKLCFSASWISLSLRRESFRLKWASR